MYTLKSQIHTWIVSIFDRIDNSGLDTAWVDGVNDRYCNIEIARKEETLAPKVTLNILTISIITTILINAQI